jgi:hypothetical protein
MRVVGSNNIKMHMKKKRTLPARNACMQSGMIAAVTGDNHTSSVFALPNKPKVNIPATAVRN